jgi:hypothetical protein
MSDFRICWRMRSRAIKVPDLPTPALQWTTMGRTRSCSGWTRSRNALTNLTKVWGGSGTPKSGHVVKWKCFIKRHWSPCKSQKQRHAFSDINQMDEQIQQENLLAPSGIPKYSNLDTDSRWVFELQYYHNTAYSCRMASNDHTFLSL